MMFTGSPKLVISDRFMKRQGILKQWTSSPKSGKKKAATGTITMANGTGRDGVMTNNSTNNEYSKKLEQVEKLRQWKISFALHMVIPFYGLVVLLVVLFPGLTH
jgi:hypothetical protein